MRGLIREKGFVLVFALWVLTFLTVIAVSVAAGVRQKILLVKRLDERRRVITMQLAGARVASAVIRQTLNSTNGQYTVESKQKLHHSADHLQNIRLDQDSVSVVIFDETGRNPQRFGVIDEESKINLNYTNVLILQNLITSVIHLKHEKARQLAESLLDWRRIGSSEIVGFFSDEYYSNLKHPYLKKNDLYETLDEILLVKGVNKAIFNQLRPFLTIFGNGQVNINTAPQVVLESLGLTSDLVDKIIEARKGKDGVDATYDDYVFIRSFDIAIELRALSKLELEEIKAIDALNAQGLLTTNSFYFTIETDGYLANGHRFPSLKAIYGYNENRFMWWKEK